MARARTVRLLLGASAVVLGVSWLAEAEARRPLRLRLSPYLVAPAKDRIPCEYVALPNRRAMDVQAFEVRAAPGLHHILLYAYLGEDRDPAHLTHGIREGNPCLEIGPPDLKLHTAGLLGAVRAGRYRLPPGYAVSIGPEQPVLAQTHFFNDSTSRHLWATARLRIKPARPGSVRHHLEPIDALDLWFELPPHATTVRETDFIVPFDMHVVMLSSHQHRRGKRVTVRGLVGGVDTGVLYENVLWDHPPLAWLDAPLLLHAGDRLRVTCEWYNDSDTVLRFGNSANDEMCNLNGYFFRDPEVPAAERRGAIAALWPVPPS